MSDRASRPRVSISTIPAASAKSTMDQFQQIALTRNILIGSVDRKPDVDKNVRAAIVLRRDNDKGADS